ncbi:MAG TPA: ABC transporter ATP-binding protein [Jatrophihabitans sp.]|jgi:branched-chain amino acid transport system ATP-binding protein
MAPLFEMKDIDAGYGSMKTLFGINVAVDEGGVLALLGPNGAGKTTTLRAAIGLLRQNAGVISFDGQDVSKLRARARARLGMCLVPEGRGIFPNLTVRENLQLHSYAKSGLNREEIEETTFTRFPALGRRPKQIAGTMSGGEQQMLALSRALTTQPRLLLLDEISMGLAPRLVGELFQVIKDEVANRKVTVVIVEQLADYALDIADTVVVLSRGYVAATGSPDEVRDVLDAAYLGKDANLVASVSTAG